MSTFIQIHTLTSHSTHNLNRDDLGQPKSVEFLGHTHGRISSQCLKRAIRNTMKDELHGKVGWRTRKLPKLVKEYLEGHEIDTNLIKVMTQEIASLGMNKKATEGTEETQLIFLTHQELEEVKDKALQLCQENEESKLTEKTKKEIGNAIRELFKTRKFKDGVDIAMFGRMTTSDVFEDCDAAIQVAHAITTHPVKNQDDFFTAVDDLGEDETGAGHMDEKYYNTGIFYKYASINFDQLASNLADDKELAKNATSAFCKAFVTALPTGSQNAMAAHQHPFVILITLGNGANSNLANAFADLAHQRGNLLKLTAQAMIQEFKSEQDFFGDLKAVETALLACQKPEFLEKDDQTIDLGTIQKTNTLKELWQQMESSLQGVV